MSLVVLSTLTLGLTGCSNISKEPTPYKFSVKDISKSKISMQEKRKILIHSVKTLHNSKRFYCKRCMLRNGPKTGQFLEVYSEVSIMGDVLFTGLSFDYAHKFIINDKNEIERIDISYGVNRTNYKKKGKEVYGFSSNDKGFNDYIKDFQLKLPEVYKNEIKKFLTNKKEFFVDYKHQDNIITKHQDEKIEYEKSLNFTRYVHDGLWNKVIRYSIPK